MQQCCGQRRSASHGWALVLRVCNSPAHASPGWLTAATQLPGPTRNSTPCFLRSPPSLAPKSRAPLYAYPAQVPLFSSPAQSRVCPAPGSPEGPRDPPPPPGAAFIPTPHPPAPPPRALTFFAAARTRLSSPPPLASASRPGCCACSPCARRCRCGRAGTRRAPGPARAGTRPCWWSESGTATPAAGSVYSPGTWSASARAPCLGTATGTGSASCCVCCSWCVWSGTSCGSETGPSFRAALCLTNRWPQPRTRLDALAWASGRRLATR